MELELIEPALYLPPTRRAALLRLADARGAAAAGPKYVGRRLGQSASWCCSGCGWGASPRPKRLSIDSGLARRRREIRARRCSSSDGSGRPDRSMAGWPAHPCRPGRGRAELAAELDASGARAVVDDAYDASARSTSGFSQLCTDWQLAGEHGETVVNDHAETGVRCRGHRRLVEIHGDVQPICPSWPAPWSGSRLRPLLTRRSDRVRDGETTGSPSRPSTRTTRCGSSCTRTCWRRSGSSAPRRTS